MEALPNEILLEVFQHLTVYSQLQCLQVCKLWNTAARACINSQKVEIYDESDVTELTQEISSNPARGLSIRQMYFFRPRNYKNWPKNYITQDKLFALITRCPNLGDIVLDNEYPRACFECLLADNNLDLPKLEMIQSNGYPASGFNKATLKIPFKYRKSLNRVIISINRNDLKISPMDRIEDYIQIFTNLKCLKLTTSCPIVFDAIIKACPQLQIFKLKFFNDTYFRVTADSNTGHQGNSLHTKFQPSQLEVLQINHDLMTVELYSYLRCFCKYLSHLVLLIRYERASDPLVDTFRAFQANPLRLSTISFKSASLSQTKLLAQGLDEWFPLVNQVDVDCFHYDPATWNNFSLDFCQKNLVCLSVDVSALFPSRSFGCSKGIALEIITRNAPVFYYREGNWDTDSQFFLLDDDQYADASTPRATRLKSSPTALISIQAQSIRMLYVHFECHQKSFTQVIHLNQ